MDPLHRLRLATRIHYGLLRQFGHTVEVAEILCEGAQSREALFVCEASGDVELVGLASSWKNLHPAQPKVKTQAAAPVRNVATAAAARPAPQDAHWARDTSGFGVSAPMTLTPMKPRSRHSEQPRPAATGLRQVIARWWR